ncbi:SMP-30/gluconolactonase/LRE family protein [Arthrobacter sp. zg-Y826]|uniref:SMP-30/gluconolactonase/LRE family protein n=1 Tax=Arthrobacter jinronghuae TaxID=2964609 RepID=UPI0021029F93|nr:SMP-30/gluconolactonase/LRE family protein [Arthrobacter jinronghuae]MCQ1957721.1 SMP-30/gluconolactonase/LRE family protein [Arthrobacter jinronghuae]
MSYRTQPTSFPKPVRITALTLGLAAALSGCAAGDDDDHDESVSNTGMHGVPEQTAERVVQVSSVHPETGMTLIEGPTFGPDGGLFVVDVTAPAGEAKVMRVDVEDESVSRVYTEGNGAYTSAQFSPNDGRIYLTDFAGGKIDSITPDGRDHKTFFTGDVDGSPMRPDDLAFDEEGNLFVSDSTGYADPAWEAKGRVVRIDKDTAEATVLAENLAAPNGISFSEDFKALWVSQYMDNRIDYLVLNEDKTEVTTSHPGMHFDGGTSQTDSNAVDADGNVYQAIHGQPRIFVYSPHGELLSTITVPAEDREGLTSATNIAIKPDTKEAYLTVSGPDGGFIYEFDALSTGIRQSNGG